jgi:thiol-disulfide isomerase/thioredoxin
MKNLLIGLFVLVCEISFAQKPTRSPYHIRAGEWRGVLTLNDTTELPFTFTLDLQPARNTLTIHNATENIQVENLLIKGDSINWHMPVFDSWFRCKIDSLGGFHGRFYNRAASKPYELKFRAECGRSRFYNLTSCDRTANYSGKYECDFSPGTADSSKAIGIFKQTGWKITGTFLTETGDYRFLEGELVNCNELAVSCFDGSHAFLFKMKPGRDGKYIGFVWYGKYGHENWTAKSNENFQLRDPEKLTFVKDSSNINFTFNDLNGKPVSLSDPKFKGKVVIIQIMGSWCPNCMDETAWMTDVYKNYNSQGLEVIGLAYERSSDTAIANANIRRLQKHYGVDYTLLNTGKSGRDAASASLPFLNGIMSFPTTIYIDRSGKVRMVYTGYNGPATGVAYEKDSAEAIRLIQQLLAEKAK